MAKMTLENVIKQLVELGVDYSPEATYSELVDILKQAKVKDEPKLEGAEEVVQPVADEPQVTAQVQTRVAPVVVKEANVKDEPLVGTTGRVIATNLLVDGVYFAKGDEITTDHPLFDTIEAQGFLK
jgi:hypothetical protein